MQIQQGLRTLQQEAPGVLTGMSMSAPPFGPGASTTATTTATTGASTQSSVAPTTGTSTTTGATTTTTTSDSSTRTSTTTPTQNELATLLASMLNVMSSTNPPGSTLPNFGDVLRSSQSNPATAVSYILHHTFSLT